MRLPPSHLKILFFFYFYGSLTVRPLVTCLVTKVSTFNCNFFNWIWIHIIFWFGLYLLSFFKIYSASAFPRQHLPNSNSHWHTIIANREWRWRNLVKHNRLTTDKVKNKHKNTNSSCLDRIGQILKTSTSFIMQAPGGPTMTHHRHRWRLARHSRVRCVLVCGWGVASCLLVSCLKLRQLGENPIVFSVNNSEPWLCLGPTTTCQCEDAHQLFVLIATESVLSHNKMWNSF